MNSLIKLAVVVATCVAVHGLQSDNRRQSGGSYDGRVGSRNPQRPSGVSGSAGNGSSAGDCKSFGGPQGEKRNKDIVKAFYQEIFGDLNIDAPDKYMKEPYIQHNPIIADGIQGLKAFAKEFLKDRKPSKVDFWRVSSDDDLVWVHTGNVGNSTSSAVVDIFRMECGKIVEHWDIVQSSNR